MVGVLLVSHGLLCKEMIKSTEMIADKLENVFFVELREGESPEMFEERLFKAALDIDNGAGVLILADILGGTPFNRCAKLVKDGKAAVITGLNMAMLVSATLERDYVNGLAALTEQVSAAAIDGIKVLIKK